MVNEEVLTERRITAVEVQRELEALRKAVDNLTAQGIVLENTAKAQSVMLNEHDKILIRGNGVPSLQETVRVLSKSVSDFIVEVKEERASQHEKQTKKEEQQKAEQSRWKWSLIGLAFTIVPAFVWQVLVFWFQVVPHIK